MKNVIAKVRGGGEFLELWDGSKWAIRPVDATITSSWSPHQKVNISQVIRDRTFNYSMENVDTKQNISIFALRMN